jgi:hypothetical protein
MAFYLVTRAAAAMTVGVDMMTITSVGKSLNIWSIDINGVQNASLAGELKAAYSTGGATASVSITPTRVDRNNATAASFLARGGWTTQPTIAGSDADLWLFSVNANGGKDRFPGYPQPLPVPINGQVSLRVLVGTHNVDQTWLIEELG